MKSNGTVIIVFVVVMVKVVLTHGACHSADVLEDPRPRSGEDRHRSGRALTCSLPVLAPDDRLANLSQDPLDDITELTITCNEDMRRASVIAGATLAGLGRLVRLSIEYCKVAELNADAFLAVANLKNLTIRTRNIEFTSMSLTAVAGVFSHLTQLETIDLSTNSVWELPAGVFCGLPALRSITLSHNHLQDLSQLRFGGDTDNTSCSSDITHLDLSHNDVEVVASGALKGLPHLQELYLNNNQLAKVDDLAFEGLASLHTLDMSGNKLVALPEDAFLPTPQLMYFRGANNSLSVLAPGLFRGLQHLVELDLSHNELKAEWLTESSFQGLIRLIVLNLSHNKIDTLDVQVLRDMYSVQVLILSHNHLTEIPPAAFSSCVNLHTLDLSHNKLNVIGEKAFQGVSVLSFLALDNNAILSVHSAAFTNLTGLRDLNLNGNKLSEIPEATSSLRYLNSLDLGQNLVQSLHNMPVRGLQFLYGLRLAENKIAGNISKNTFHDLPSLKVLNLAKNSIEHIEEGAFETNSKLHAVRLDGNLLTSMNGLFENLPNLKWLNVSANKLEVFDYYFIPSNLLWLSLHNNKIYELSNSFGRHDLHLEILDVSKNELKHISSINIPDSVNMVFMNDNNITTVEPFTFFKKVNLSRVDLFSNELSTLEMTALRLSDVPPEQPLPQFFLGDNPFVCDCEMEWLQRVNNLEHLRIYPTLMEMDHILCQMPFARSGKLLPLNQVKPSQFLCKYETHCFALCHCCEFDACDCEMTCPDGCGCYHEQSWGSNIVDCSRNSLLVVPDKIPMDASEVYLDGNDFRNLSSHSFLGRKHLQMLYVNSSNVKTLDNGTFSGLTRLISLHLEDNFIESLRGHEFKGLDLLRELYLHNNLLKYIHQHTFALLSHLEILSLHSNHLINFPVWRLVDNPYLTSVSLRENFWTCECQFVDSFDIWLSKNIRKVADSDEIKCFPTDRDIPGAFILDYNGTTCTNSSTTSTVVQPLTFHSLLHPVIAICVAFVLVVVLLILFLYRNALKVWLHSQCGLRLCNESSSDDRDKLYDAFVSYSSKDEAWVNQVLAADLEQGVRPYRICLHYRDFPVTAYIAETMAEAVESSKRTIIVLSKNFIENEWCRFQFKSAHHEVMKRKRKRLIVIVLGDIPSKDLDADLRLYLKTNTCIYTGDKLFWEKLRFAMPDVSSTQRIVHTYSTIPERTNATKLNVSTPSSLQPSLQGAADGTYWA
uniref:Toll family protein LongTollA n=1 Tax=Parhyale hawaiensis TaxID=317513 RepID=A0A173ADU6_9CRUS|nr:toll family protein LongTollA [Parhyale hawaiensis]